MPRENRVLTEREIVELTDLTRRVLERDGRESSYIGKNHRLVAAPVTRLDNMALIKGDRRIECHLILERDAAAIQLQCLMFAFAVDDSGSWRLETGDADIRYDAAIVDLREHLNRKAWTAE